MIPLVVAERLEPRVEGTYLLYWTVPRVGQLPEL